MTGPFRASGSWSHWMFVTHPANRQGIVKACVCWSVKNICEHKSENKDKNK